jgi:transcriptional regulator with XRE-family HTH domain
MDMIMVFGKDDVRRLRDMFRMNLREFGDLVGVTEATVSRWETGGRRPSLEDMIYLNELWKVGPAGPIPPKPKRHESNGHAIRNGHARPARKTVGVK